MLNTNTGRNNSDDQDNIEAVGGRLKIVTFAGEIDAVRRSGGVDREE